MPHVGGQRTGEAANRPYTLGAKILRRTRHAAIRQSSFGAVRSLSTNHKDSLFVGFCKGVNSGGGLYEYPLNSERNEFLIPNTQSTLLNVNHEKFLIGENFYCVSDMELGSDNIIYLTDYVSNGAIYKIAPKQ